MSKSFYTEKDNSINYSSPILKTRMKKLAGDTEWAELMRHQAKVAQNLIKQEKELKKQNKEHVRNVLDSLVKEKHMKKQTEQMLKQKEGEQINQAKAHYNYETVLKRHEIKNKKKSVANTNKEILEMGMNIAKQKKEYDHKLEENINKNARASLELDKIKKQEKQEELKRHALENLAMNELAKREQKESREREKKEYNKMVDDYANYLVMKDMQYKQFYQKCHEQQQDLNRTHSELVLKKKIEKEQNLAEFIDKNIEIHQKQVIYEDYMRKKKLQENIRNTQENNKSMILEKERKKKDEREAYQDKVQQTLQEIDALNYYLNQVRTEKKKKKDEYRESLHKQTAEKEERILNSMKMGHHEKMINSHDLDHCRNSEVKIKSMIPGITPNKHVRVRSDIFKKKYGPQDTSLNNIEQSGTNLESYNQNDNCELSYQNILASPNLTQLHTRSPDITPMRNRGKSCHQTKNSGKDTSFCQNASSYIYNENKIQANDECNKSIEGNSYKNGNILAHISATPEKKMKYSKSKTEINNSQAIDDNPANITYSPYRKLNQTSNLDYLFSPNNDRGNESVSVERKPRSSSKVTLSAAKLRSIANAHNPITNPLPFTIQNPYVLREIEKGDYQPKSFYAPFDPEYSSAY